MAFFNFKRSFKSWFKTFAQFFVCLCLFGLQKIKTFTVHHRKCLFLVLFISRNSPKMWINRFWFWLLWQFLKFVTRRRSLDTNRNIRTWRKFLFFIINLTFSGHIELKVHFCQKNLKLNLKSLNWKNSKSFRLISQIF